MTFDTVLGLFGAAMGVIGLFFAYYFYKKSVRTKVLGIAYTDPIPMLMTLGGFEVVYRGVSIGALSRVYILFWNHGTAPIEASDFLAPIRIGVSDPILNLEIHDKDAVASATLNEKERELSIALLRPGEAITLVVEVSSQTYVPDISVQMKSADMSMFTAALQYSYPTIFGFFGFFIPLALQIGAIKIWGSALIAAADARLPPMPKDPSGILLTTVGVIFLFCFFLFVAIPGGISAVVYKFSKRAFGRTITPVAWKFSAFKTSSMSIRTRFDEFRRFADTEYKKIGPS